MVNRLIYGMIHRSLEVSLEDQLPPDIIPFSQKFQNG
jgi:hypothetical protein